MLFFQDSALKYYCIFLVNPTTDLNLSFKSKFHLIYLLNHYCYLNSGLH